MKVFFSAAEASSDTHAAEALNRLRKLCSSRGVELDAFGIGGPKLRAAGLRAIIPAEDFLAMGFVEVVSRLPKIRKHLQLLGKSVAHEKPDAAILCDYPEFHFKLARRLKGKGFPLICYIPPKIWVWRKNRIQFLARYYDRVLSILPFEEEVYRGSEVAFRYVGNPLVDELPLGLSRETARSELGLDNDDQVLLLMVGSRPSEFKFHLETMIQAARLIAAQDLEKKLKICIPLPQTADETSFREALAKVPESSDLDVRISRGNAWTVMRAADAGIIKSGTSSLEAALLDCPHVVVYRAHPISEFIFRHVIRYQRSISLTNLVAAEVTDEKAVAELILEDFTPEKMADEIGKLLGSGSGDRVKAMHTRFQRIREVLGSRSPSDIVAEEIYALASGTGREAR